MSNEKYTGSVKGFQVISTMGGKITVHPQTARNLNIITEELLKIYNVDELRALRESFADHTTDSFDPHHLDLPTLPEDILVDIYNRWLGEGNRDSFGNFVRIFFSDLDLAESDEDLESDRDDLVFSVAQLKRLLWLHHTGPIYTHIPIMDQMFKGEPVCDVPCFSAYDISTQTELECDCRIDSATLILRLDYEKSDDPVIFFKSFSKDMRELIRVERTGTVEVVTVTISDGNISDSIFVPISKVNNRIIVGCARDKYMIGYKTSNDVITYVEVNRITDPDVDDYLCTMLLLNKAKSVYHYPRLLNMDNVAYILT